MHRRLHAFISVLLLFPLFLSACTKKVSFAFSDTSAVLKSESVFLCDLNSGDVFLYPDTGDQNVYPASITKLLTALTALSILSPDTLISPGEEVYFPAENASSAFIRPHHQLTLDMLIEGMLLPSGDDAAYAIAAACGRALSEDPEQSAEDAVSAFVAEMNRYAAWLGCTGTHMTVPDGYAGSEHVSTLCDMLLICRAALEEERIAAYAAMARDSVTYASGHTNEWVNTNRQLDPDSGFYNPHVTGLKTGSLSHNYSLVTLYEDGSCRLLIGVFGAPNDDARYRDTQTLINLFLNSD